MTIVQNTGSAVATIDQDDVGQALMGHQVDFARMLGGTAEAERFIQEAFAAVNANPFLRRCTPESLFGALYFAAQIGLPVGGPLQQFHLTPRSVWSSQAGRKVWQVVPVIGYGGLIRLAMNSGEYDAIEGKLVYSNDDFEAPYDDETGTHFKLRQAQGDRGEVVGVIGRALVKGADRSIIEYLTKEQVLTRHRPTDWERTPWAKHEAQMIQKTGVRVVSKYTSKSANSTRFALAMEGDTAVVNLGAQGELEVDHSEPAREDWKGLLVAAADAAEVEAIWKRMVDPEVGESRETIEDLRPFVMMRGSELKAKGADSRADRPSPEEVAAAAVGRDPEEDYQARAIREHEAAIAAGAAA